MSDVAAFFVCAACGIAGGAGYEPFFALRAVVRLAAPRRGAAGRMLAFACDFAWCACLAALFLFALAAFELY